MRGSSLRYMGHFLRNNHNATPATMAAARTETSHIACVASKRKSISQPSAPSAVGLAAPDRAAISLFKWMAGASIFQDQASPPGATALHRALGLRPWNASPFDTIDHDKPPAWMTEREREDWHAAAELRRQLAKAAKV